MNFSNLVFENIEDKTKEYFFDVVKETMIDTFTSQNINFVSFQKRINYLVFENEKTRYGILIEIDNGNVSYSLYGYLIKRFTALGSVEIQKQFTNEYDLAENTKKIIQDFIQRNQETEEKINKIEDVFEEFFKSIKTSLPSTIEFWLEDIGVINIENSLKITKKARVFINRQLLGSLVVTYDADSRLPTPDIYIELLFDQRNYKTIEELLTLGRDFVVQTLTKRYGNK